MKAVSEDLIEAARSGDEMKLEALLLRSGRGSMFRDCLSMTALMWAARNGHAACVELLIPASDALAKDNNGWTALMLASYQERTSCVELLIPVSDALARSNDGMTALMYAAMCGQTACAEILIPVSNAVAKDNNGSTASCLARQSGHASLADFIEAYTLALFEMSVLGSLVVPGAPRKKAPLRV